MRAQHHECCCIHLHLQSRCYIAETRVRRANTSRSNGVVFCAQVFALFALFVAAYCCVLIVRARDNTCCF